MTYDSASKDSMHRCWLHVCTLLALLNLVSQSGCALLLDPIRKLPEATASNPVKEVICLWQAAEGTNSDGRPTRGFAGQLLFFAAREDETVRVDGDVRVYVFDDQGTPEEQAKPIHQFDFNSHAFEAFLTETNLGAAYQFFIPYTREGSHKATCSLRVKYTSPNGRNVYSKIAQVILPGTGNEKPINMVTITNTKQDAKDRNPKSSGIVQASYESSAEQSREPKRLHKLSKTTTIESSGINRQQAKAKLSEIAGQAAQ